MRYFKTQWCYKVEIICNKSQLYMTKILYKKFELLMVLVTKESVRRDKIFKRLFNVQ